MAIPEKSLANMTPEERKWAEQSMFRLLDITDERHGRLDVDDEKGTITITRTET